MSDELLNYMADRFVRLRIEALLGITFAAYLLDPAGYEQTAAFLQRGGGLCAYYAPARQVGKTAIHRR